MKTFKITPVLMILSVLVFTGCALNAEKKETKEAVYLGVEGYGLEETNKDNKEEFLYRFQVNGNEITYKLSNGAKD